MEIKNTWPLVFLFGGISVVLSIELLEQAMATKIPADLIRDFIPVDSLLVPDKRRLVANRNSEPHSASLTGTDDYIAVPTDQGNLPDDFTLTFWTKIDTSGTEQTLLMKGENCPDGNYDFKGLSWEIVLQADGSLTMKLVAPPGNYNDQYIRFTSVDAVPLHQWTFIAIAFDLKSAKFRYWLNAKPQEIKEEVGPSPGTLRGIHQTKSVLKIGANENYCGYQHKFENFFHGSIDDIYIFSGPLSEEEFLTLYVNPAAKLFKYKIALLLLLISFVAIVSVRHFSAR